MKKNLSKALKCLKEKIFPYKNKNNTRESKYWNDIFKATSNFKLGGDNINERILFPVKDTFHYTLYQNEILNKQWLVTQVHSHFLFLPYIYYEFIIEIPYIKYKFCEINSNQALEELYNVVFYEETKKYEPKIITDEECVSFYMITTSNSKRIDYKLGENDYLYFVNIERQGE